MLFLACAVLAIDAAAAGMLSVAVGVTVLVGDAEAASRASITGIDTASFGVAGETGVAGMEMAADAA